MKKFLQTPMSQSTQKISFNTTQKQIEQIPHASKILIMFYTTDLNQSNWHERETTRRLICLRKEWKI